MRAENDQASFRDQVDIVNEYDAFGLEVVNDRGVVHDLMEDVQGGAVFIESLFHYPDSPRYAGAKSLRPGKVNLH